MSDTITQNFVQQFDTSLRMLAAQMDSRLRMAVTDRGTITGESFTINNIDPTGDLPADNVRHGDTVFSDITHTARVVTMKDFFDALRYLRMSNAGMGPDYFAQSDMRSTTNKKGGY